MFVPKTGNNTSVDASGAGVLLKLTVNVFGSAGNTALIFCYEGGPYATGQDAINAVPANTNGACVVFGPRKSPDASTLMSWGPLVLPPDIPMSITSFATPRSKSVIVGGIQVNSTGATNILFNEYYISNLYISNTSALTNCLDFTGTGKARLRVYGCYLQADAGGCLRVDNSGTPAIIGTPSIYVYDSIFGTLNSTPSLVRFTPAATVPNTFLRMQRNTLDISGQVMTISAGTVTAEECEFNGNTANGIITLTAPSQFFSTNSSFSNSNANGSGIDLQVGSTFYTDLKNVYNIGVAAGTGFAVKGLLGTRISGTNSSVRPSTNANVQTPTTNYTTI